MTLPEVAFFPHTLLPLFIFEPRYRKMLRDVLDSHRIFAVVGLDLEAARAGGREEPPLAIGAAGIVHLCQGNPDGTSNLGLLGLWRVRVERIARERPYRVIEVSEVPSEADVSEAELQPLRRDLLEEVRQAADLGQPMPKGLYDHLCRVREPEVQINLAAQMLSPSAELQQRLLETLSIPRRCAMLLAALRERNERLRLERKLQGGLPDERVAGN